MSHIRFENQMLEFLESLKNIKGDFAEFGIFQGGTFINLAPIAKSQNKVTHAFDSFKGLAEPSKFDVSPTGITAYPKGKFNVNGTSSLIKKMSKLNFEQNKDYFLWEGFIPDIFYKTPKDINFSFCYIDLDHYLPTKHTLEWVWNKLSKNGIILCDDYNDKAITGSAPKAIYEFLNSKTMMELEIIEEGSYIKYNWNPKQIVFKKLI